MSDFCYDRFEAGAKFNYALMRPVKEMDNFVPCTLTYNPQLHFDEECSKQTENGQYTVNSQFTVSLKSFEQLGFNRQEEEVTYCVRNNLVMKRP